MHMQLQVNDGIHNITLINTLYNKPSHLANAIQHQCISHQTMHTPGA